MNLIENWRQIVEQQEEQAIISFLKQLDKAQKKTLLPTISETAKEYLEIKDRLINNKHFYAKKASNKQDRILNYSIFVCTEKPHHALHKWLDVHKIITPFVVHHILNWYCPKWLSAYLNEFGKQDFIPLNIRYELVLKMMDLGYVQPSDLLMAKLLTRVIFPEVVNQKWIHQFQPEVLLKHPDTLTKHIWYLFENNTKIYQVNRHFNLVDKENLPKNCWYAALKKYADSGQINRLKLLKAGLQATTNTTFNKPSVGWFAGLFEYLCPTKEELLKLQTGLFSTFTLSHAKAIIIALKNIKKIVLHPNFKVEDGLENFELLLTSQTKSINTLSLDILEKLTKSNPTYRAKICELATHAFIHREEHLQRKATKIICDYGIKNNNNLLKKIQPYSPNLFYKTQQALSTLGFKKNAQKFDNQSHKRIEKKIICSKKRIPPLQSFDDFLKLTLQVFDNQQPYHFDQFLAGLLKYQNELKGANIDKFVPVFKKAYQLVFNELPSHQGMIDNILGIFFMDLGDLLIAKYPADSQELRKIAAAYLEQGFFVHEEGTSFELQYANLYRWYNPYDPSEVYTPLKKLLGGVLNFLHQEKKLPLLSTPTHVPMWVNPEIFVEKLAIYQVKNESPNAIDLQLAISRFDFEGSKKALKIAKSLLSGKHLDLVEFLCAKNTPLPVYIQQKNLSEEDFSGTTITEHECPFYYGFLTAAITKNSAQQAEYFTQLPDLKLKKNYFTGCHPWMVFWEERRLEDWNHKTQRLEFVGEPYIHREIQVKIPKGMNIQDYPNFLYQYFPGNDEPFRPNVNDVQRLLGMLPNNPEPLIALLIADNLKYPTFWEEDARKRVLQVIEWLSPLKHKIYGQSIHLFIAAGMLCADRPIRERLAKIWENGVTQQIIDSPLLGKLLGKMERKEFAPFKRFTDLAQNHLFNLSAVHNRALESLVAHLLAKLPAIPIKSTQKLLVLYRELLAMNQSCINNERLILLLALWKTAPALRKVIRELKAFVE